MGTGFRKKKYTKFRRMDSISPLPTQQVHLPLLRFSSLTAFAGITHGITTREGGVSSGHAATLNLSYSVGDDPVHVQENRRRVARAMGVAETHLIFPRQTHSVNVKIITAGNFTEVHEDTDAVISAEPGMALGVMSADCVPVLFYDPVREVIAAAHAGWKGTVGGIVRRVVECMISEFHCSPNHIHAGIGPSIGPEVYEVGPEVVEQFEKNFPNADALLKNRQSNGKAHADLWQANATWLRLAGVPEAQIEIAGLCTLSHPQQFFSARYDQHKTGRFAAVICKKPKGKN